MICGPAGEDPPVVDLDHAHAERLAASALAEPDRHIAIRFLASALEGDPGEQPGLRNKGLLATHELLHGVPARRDWENAAERSRPLLGLRSQELVRGLGYEIEPRGQHNVLRASSGRAQAVAVFLQDRLNTPGADRIHFDIPGTGVSGVHTIFPETPLPTITEALTIDGYTEGTISTPSDTSDDATVNTSAGGTNAELRIELRGSRVGGIGLTISASNSVIKGLMINRFNDTGVRIFGDVTGVRVEGNFIGTDVDGDQELSNGNGVIVSNGASDSTIGRSTPEARNIISGNAVTGVSIQDTSGGLTTNNKVLGNLIGTKNDGTSALPNDKSGVTLTGASNNTVGGSTAAAANTIAFNGGDGVRVGTATFNGNNPVVPTGDVILRNSIFSNAGLGIELLGPDEDSTTDVPTANDGGTADDSDAGPNGLQNKPVLTSATTTTIVGVLDSKPDTPFTVRYFSQGGGNEGKKFIGQKRVPTDADGRVTFTFSPANAVAAGHKITATATGPEGTSEFSAPREVTAS